MQIAVVGTGLIGASLGLAWRARGHAVVGYDACAGSLDAALARGAFEGAVSFDQARGSEVLVLAVPLNVVCALLGQLRDGAPNPPLILDVASLQVPVLRAAGDLRGFVATHPLAGREGNGAVLADAGLFRRQPWIYQPGQGAAVGAAVRLIEETGATPIAMEAEVHDRAVTVTSHWPQLLAVALAQCVGRHAGESGVAQVVGPGLRGALRLARARYSMWGPLLAEQGSRDAELLEELAVELRAMAAALRERGQPSLERHFEQGSAALQQIFRDEK